MEMVEWEVSPKKKKQCSVERYARLQIAFVQLQTEYKNEAGYIVIMSRKGVGMLNNGEKLHFNVKKFGLLRPFLYLCKTKITKFKYG